MSTVKKTVPGAYCCLCSRQYSEARTLRCEHLFCLTCLEGQVCTGRRGNRYIACPTCSTVTKVPKGTEIRELNTPVLVKPLTPGGHAQHSNQEDAKRGEHQGAQRDGDICRSAPVRGKGMAGWKAPVSGSAQVNKEQGRHVTNLKRHSTGSELYRTLSDRQVTFVKDAIREEEDTGSSSPGCPSSASPPAQRHQVDRQEAHGYAELSPVLYRERKEHNPRHRHSLDPRYLGSGGLLGYTYRQGALSSPAIGKDSTFKHSTTFSSDTHLNNIDYGAYQRMSLPSVPLSNMSGYAPVVSKRDETLNKLDTALAMLQTVQLQLQAAKGEVMSRAGDHVISGHTGQVIPFMTSLDASPGTVVDDMTVPEPGGGLTHLLGSLRHAEIQPLLVWSSMDRSPPSSRSGRPELQLTLEDSFTTTTTVHDVMFNALGSQVIVRTRERKAPVKVYDLEGKLLGQMGRDVKALAGVGALALDTHRDFYLAACDGHLTAVTSEGQVGTKIRVPRCSLRGVAYIRERDLYVVSDVTQHKVKLLDPRAGAVVTTFGGQGRCPGQYNNPCFLASYADRGRPVVAVSDCHNHRVQLLDLYGTPLHSYGRRGTGPGQLLNPWGVALAPGGRLFVCDFSNSRVVGYWREGREERWACMAQTEALQYPGAVDIHHHTRKVAVCVDKTVKLYSF